MTPVPMVSVGIVTWNCPADIEACLPTVRAQSWPAIELLVGDNASTDGKTREAIARLTRPEERVFFDENRGFTAGHNALMARTSGDFYLCLNPDVVLDPDYVRAIVEAMLANPRAGSATGKLLRKAPSNVIDTTGIVMTRDQRHLDRGADEEDVGRYETPEEVFGASGAAAMYRRAMLEETKVLGEHFDEDFFTYREDADLSWRAQLYGWTCLYVPSARGRHVRLVTPGRRSRLPAWVNRAGVRNRFLLRIKNQTFGHAVRFLVPALVRDAQVVGYVVLREWSSLPGLLDVVRLLPRMLRKRRVIMRHRRASSRDLARWFTNEKGHPDPISPMRLAILGTRGIPANYGGFETFAEELSVRLVARGHDVTVYCRPHYVPRSLTHHRGVRLVSLPTVRQKYLDTVVHTAISSLHAAARGRFDAVLFCNAANALFCWLPRLAGTAVALNVDGVERKRRKWNALGRLWYLASERLATWLPHDVVTDARVMQAYYRERYRCESTFIPYGCEVGRHGGTGTLERFALRPDEYVLYVSRLEPENNAHAVIQAFENTQLNRKLVIVGDAPYARQYVASLRGLAGPRVVFTGGVYGEGYRELQSHAFVYVHATEVGGTHPALVEAMGFGNCVLVNDTPENREVAADAGLYFDARRPDTLTELLERLDREGALVQDLRARAAARAASSYSWDHVTDEYERLFRRLTHGRRGDAE